MRFVEIIRRNGVPINGSTNTVEAGLYQKRNTKNGIKAFFGWLLSPVILLRIGAKQTNKKL